MYIWFLHQCSWILFLYLPSLNSNGVFAKGMPKGKIVGGQPVKLASYPSAVLFYNMESQCAGSILNTYTVLTAAHCFDLNKDTSQMVVEVGARYLYDFHSTVYDVFSFIVHENYNKIRLFSCDIALIFVMDQIQFNSKVKRAILVNNNNWMKSHQKQFRAIGWGQTSYGGSQSEQGLLMTELEYVTPNDCGAMHNIKLSSDMFCLYGHGRKDTCKGDSGGGVWWNGMVVGITSHGDGCANVNKPSVYANVWYFRKWIEEKVEDFFSTHCDRT